MPHPPVYNGGQDDDQTRSIDLVHIEPSIREGTKLVSSLYGSDASAPIWRFPPTNVNPPFITGSNRIPATLTCEPGSWNGSPTPNYAYQWMLDGIDVAGATNQTFETTIPMDGQAVTCEVRGYNNQGENYAVTPTPVNLTIIDPIETFDQGLYVINGWGNLDDIWLSDRITTVVTGIPALNVQTVLRSTAYFATGLSADTRTDTNAMSVCFVGGLGSNQKQEVFSADGVSVISYMEGFPLVTGIPQPIPLKNWGAEMGLEGWTVFGDVEARADLSNDNEYYEGIRSFSGGRDVHPEGQNIPYSYITQDVDLWPEWHTDIDTGNCFLELEWHQHCRTDQANVRVEFLDQNGLSLGSADPSGLWATPSDIWYLLSYPNIAIPANTRTIRYTIEFLLISGFNIDAFVDAVSSRIRLGAQIVDRDFGPNFERWRLRFTKSEVYNGASLSELEFRATSGGADLATGGSVLFGSVGNNGSAAAAFDDARNALYWSSEPTGITNNTAWIGYNMGTPVKPQELDITARQGAEAVQMGSEFYLEGSNDSINWVPVQFYYNVPAFTAGEQRQFPVYHGNIPFKWNGTEGNDLRNLTSLRRVAGLVWQSTARQNITHIQVNSFMAQAFRIIYGHITRYGNSFTLDEGFLTHDIATTHSAAFAYEEFALPTPLEVEVDDLFVIALEDLANTHSTIPLWYNHDDNNGTIDLTNWPTARRITNVQLTDNIYDRGTVFSGSVVHALDFRSTIF